MDAVLGIDAAWTEKNPSGVALVCGSSDDWTCRALAPSYASFLASCQGTPVNWAKDKPTGGRPDVAALLGASRGLLGGKCPVAVVALDIPISKSPITGRRLADDQLSAAFGARGCAAHSPNSRRPGAIGRTLSDGLAASGYTIAATETPAGTPHRAIEVYPHPALLRLLQADYRVPYKAGKSRRYWPNADATQRRANLLRQMAEIGGELNARIRGAEPVLQILAGATSFAQLKRFEDAIDALICAWCGIRYLAGQAMAYGDEAAAIWVPEESGRNADLWG